jgi:hypothetical protein
VRLAGAGRLVWKAGADGRGGENRPALTAAFR